MNNYYLKDSRSNLKINELSHLILSEIVIKLDDTLDIICFSLVCKRLYNDREKYIRFNFHKFRSTPHWEQYTLMTSYINLFKEYAYTTNNKTKNIIQYGTSNIDSLKVDPRTERVVLDVYDEDYDILYKKFENTNIKHIEYQRYIRSRLTLGRMNNITSIYLPYMDREIEPGDLPPNLKILIFNFECSQYNYHFKPKALPDSLEELTLPRLYNQNLNNLPLNLKRLTVGFRFKFKPLDQWHLPPNLISLYINHHSTVGSEYDDQ